MKFFYTHVLRSRKDGKLYIGWCQDLQKRLNDHNHGKVSATKTRKPLQLIYFEGCLEERLAIKREKALKTGFGRAYLKRRLKL